MRWLLGRVGLELTLYVIFKTELYNLVNRERPKLPLIRFRVHKPVCPGRLALKICAQAHTWTGRSAAYRIFCRCLYLVSIGRNQWWSASYGQVKSNVIMGYPSRPPYFHQNQVSSSPCWRVQLRNASKMNVCAMCQCRETQNNWMAQ